MAGQYDNKTARELFDQIKEKAIHGNYHNEARLLEFIYNESLKIMSEETVKELLVRIEEEGGIPAIVW